MPMPLGFKHTQETKRKIGLGNTGIKNGQWKGDEVGLNSLHEWVKIRKPKPEFCESCSKNPPYDLANKSGLYLRDLSDWEYLCRKCHMTKDGRIKTFYINGGVQKGYKRTEENKNNISIALKKYYANKKY